MKARGKKMRLQIDIQANGELIWTAGDYPLAGRAFTPAEEVMKKDAFWAEYREKNGILGKARQLARQGQKQEAKKVLNDFIATSPWKKWQEFPPLRRLENEAKEILTKLD